MARILGWQAVLIVMALALGLFAAGFVVFANTLVIGEGDQVQRADGIVVLTGGTARIEAGVKLLSQGRAKRLLISGVHPSTTREELRHLFPEGAALFRCCIDLDRRAVNTSGNAAETRNWTQTHGFSSLIVVTSSYHMPRTLVELHRAMPGIDLIPFAVAPRDMSLKTWWSEPATARLLLVEYVKYLPALARSQAEWLMGRRDDVPALGVMTKRP